MSAVIVDQRAEAESYMTKHKIRKLFDIIGAQLAKHKPDDPNEFLLTELRRISELKLSKQPVTLFTENDIEIMFSIFDLTNRGYITQTQYLKALEAVGITTPLLPVPREDKIDKRLFIQHVYAEVIKDCY